MTELTQAEILNQLLQRYAGTIVVKAWGETSLFYNPGKALPRGVYFATLKDKDGANDRASNLDRDGVFRLNIGTSKPLYLESFGPPPPRPCKGGVIVGPWDFTMLNRLTPHPVYGWMSWVAVLNPNPEMLADIGPMIDSAYEKAAQSFKKRMWQGRPLP